MRLDGEPATGAEESWFDLTAELGARGYKYVPPAARYLLAAARRALADAGPVLAGVPEVRRGLALGTNSGIASVIDAMDETVNGPGADLLSPARAPYFSINTLAGRVAMEHGVKGWNLTLTSPRTAGLEALLAGTRAVRAGRSDLLLAGSAEAPLPVHAPGHERSEAGAAVLVLEPRATAVARGAAGYGACRTVAFFLPPHEAASTAAARTVTAAVARLLGEPAVLPAVIHLVTDPSPVGTALAARLQQLGARLDVVPAGAGTLQPVLHLVHGLARPGTVRLVVTASPDGACAMTLLQPDQPADQKRDFA
ncbi:hypothetical protein AVL59_31385 [Streptomyces griseochromogenes]|uniref:Beta-ketoacyl synthase-like N-terminal domain-containing protein n=1 Tax=Streptomyces griseochromogenes TaxID=68214 RepID=A0A1B1BDM9_9ACTN|nr:hypothetical protein AVL59_31385 [Streptomyces griseochromogenes]